MAGFPYENATSGKAALIDMQKVLQSFGATSFGVMERWESGDVIVQFELRGRRIQVAANSYGYTKAWLTRNKTQKYNTEHQNRAIKLGQTAVYSILRDWIKGQVTAIEVGMLTFDQAFLSHIVLDSGETVMERIEQQKILPQLPAPR